MKLPLAVLAAALIGAPGANALAAGEVSPSFACLSDNSGSCSDFAPGLSLTVSDAGSGLVSFVFSNTIAIARSSIATIYFDNASLFDYSQSAFSNTEGVRFQAGGTPAVLPAGNPIGFTADFIASSLNPGPKYGINSGEVLNMQLTLAGGQSFADVVSALVSGDLRVGMHVISLGNYSESFVSNVMAPVPEPATYAMLMGGLACVGLFARRGARQNRGA